MKDIASYKRALLPKLRRGTLTLGIGLFLMIRSGAMTFSDRVIFMPEAAEPVSQGTELLALAGMPFFYYGIWVCLSAFPAWIVLNRSITALRKTFPTVDMDDIRRQAEFTLEEIGAYVYQDHLFLISDKLFRLEDLSKVEWLFTCGGGSRVALALDLTVSRDDKSRSRMMVPYSQETFFSPSQLWLQSRPNTERLLDWLKEKYPHIRTGYTKEQEKAWLTGQPLWKKILEMALHNY